MKINQFAITEDGFVEFLDVDFKISRDDFLALKNIVWPEMEATLGKKLTLGEVLLACLTYGLHQGVEGVTGKKWVLRMDRDNEA